MDNYDIMFVWPVMVALEDIMNTDKYHQFNSFEEFKEKIEELTSDILDYMDMSDNEFSPCKGNGS